MFSQEKEKKLREVKQKKAQKRLEKAMVIAHRVH